MKHKWITTFGTLASIISVGTTISCSTTWTKWEKNENQIETKQTFSHKNGLPEQYEVRDKATLLSIAFDDTSKTLDLEKINNQFELLYVISYILNLTNINSKHIDAYWNDYPGMKNYLSQITKKLDFQIKYKDKIETIKWDQTTTLEAMITALDNYQTNDLLGLDVDGNGRPLATHQKEVVLNSKTNEPENLGDVIMAGVKLSNINIIKAFLAVSGVSPFVLAKLVNLPMTVFARIPQFMNSLDELWNQIIPVVGRDISSNLLESPFKSWNKDKRNDYTINDIGDTGALNKINTNENLSRFYKGNFIAKIL